MTLNLGGNKIWLYAGNSCQVFGTRRLSSVKIQRIGTISRKQKIYIFNPRIRVMNKEQFVYYLTGFMDGESCFCIALKNQKSAKVNWVLDPIFHVTQHINNKEILYDLQRLFQCGIVIKRYGQVDTMQFVVQSRRELVEYVIPFFKKYQLITKKKDFEIFAEVVEALDNHKHKDINEFKKLLKKVFQMNGGGKQRRYKLNDVLKSLGSSETIRQT